ncbi:tyrosine-type recombinase/integrase [Roseovarius indicus]|uniref:Integrase n=1 Tax=Roseovarius indicus TaxID=540747 RepID=A0A0T5PB49_9RHOB|nr:site-specific integrase [Roseovarius indicus]KRS18228.1 integrase [Roseovarius indicus]QEW26940.1 Putative prophage CPS-53 integrase [Roseovarius indicus]SFD57419.1 Site-specific recombinase XerD [Roseovarius indicus]
MAKAMTTKAVEAFKPGPKRREIPDPALSGLYLVIQPSGVKSWALRYRYSGKPRKLTLGKWPIMGVADARAAASEAIEALELGNDPGAAKRKAKAARIEAHLSERDKIKTLLEQYAKRHLSTLKSGATVKRELDRHVRTVWGDRDIHDIARRDVIDLLDGIADSGRVVSANRVRSYLGTFFGWCVDRDIIAMSPAQGVKPVVKEKSRDRVLSDDEIRWFWRACDDLGFPWGPFGKTLLLTGQRLGEVAGISDAEIEGGVWYLSTERTKNGRSHTVPLSEAVRAVLAGVERVESRPRLIYTTTGASPLSGFHKGRNHIAERMAEIASEEAGEPVEIPHWTFHDLRRTAATGMARLGIPVRVTEAVLNHVSGTGGGIVAVYQRHDYADEKRAALDAWARLVADLVEGRSDNVVQIEGAKR